MADDLRIYLDCSNCDLIECFEDNSKSCLDCKEKILANHDKQIRDEAIENFKTDMINKINFEEKWLFDCKSNNSDTNIVFSSLRTFCENLAKQLKGEQNEI